MRMLAPARASIAIFLLIITASAAHARVHEYRLRLYHTHTDERINIVYRRGNNYDPSALRRLDYFLRDYRTGAVHHYDPRVFDLLYDLSHKFHGDHEINVICGYRTPQTNEYLRNQNEHTGVAEHSLHIQAEAIDIRLPGVRTARVRDSAWKMQRGGVGYYRDSDFVHVDVGRVRRW
jgi:uncharacterized protein YcbK (DUF882 family)